MTAQNQRDHSAVNPVFTDMDLGSSNSIPKLLLFVIQDFFEWWYIQMPILYIVHLRRVSIVLDDQLSISLLIKTFFVPWHRDTKPVGYFMGIMMRLVYLPIAIFLYLTALIAYSLFIIIWIILPLLTIVFILLTPFLP